MMSTAVVGRRLLGVLVVIGAMAGGAPAGAQPAWTPAFGLGVAPYHAAMAPDGTTVYADLVSTTAPAGTRLVVQVRRPGGPLLPVQFLSSPGVYAGSIGLAAGPDGRFVVVWSESGTLLSAVLLPGASQFSDIEPFLADAGPNGQPYVALDAAGNASVVWSTSSQVSSTATATVRVGVRPATGIPTSQQIDQVSGTLPQRVTMFPTDLAVSEAGAAIATWIERTESGGSGPSSSSIDQGYAVVRPAGGVFASPVLLASASTSAGNFGSVDSVEAAITRDGDPAAAWGIRGGTGLNPTYAVGLRTGASGVLGAPVAAATQATAPMLGDLALLPDRSALLAWRGTVAGKSRAQVAARPPGEAFGPAQTLDVTGPSLTSGPSLAVAPTGRALLGYVTYDNVTGLSDVRVASAVTGSFFSSPVTLGTGLRSAGALNLGTSAGGDGVAAWRHFEAGASAYVGDAAGLDVTGPVLTGLAVPASTSVGQATSFAVAATDIWSPVTSTSWAFGDGGSADGSSVTHAFASPGARTVTVAATDAAGNTATTQGAISVAARAGDAAGDRTAPVIGKITVTRATFAVTAKPASSSAARRKAGRGTTLRFTLSENAAVTVTFSREARGMRKGKRCVKRVGKGRSCVRLVPAGSITRSVKAGPVKIAFDGWIRGKRLTPGTYKATLTATDAASNRARSAVPRLKVVRTR